MEMRYSIGANTVERSGRSIMSKNAKAILALHIKEERQKRGLSRARLAEMLNVNSASTIGNWESGAASPDYEKLCFLADLFDVTTDYLLGRAEKAEEERVNDSELTSEQRRLIEQYDCCDEIGQDSIASCAEFHYKRCTQDPDKKQRKARQPWKIEPLFLVEGKDDDYGAMKDKLPYLRSLRRSSRKSYMEITKYLWDSGYGDEICLAYVMDIFSNRSNSRVPNQQLYGDIEAFLTDRYRIVPI